MRRRRKRNSRFFEVPLNRFGCSQRDDSGRFGRGERARRSLLARTDFQHACHMRVLTPILAQGGICILVEGPCRPRAGTRSSRKRGAVPPHRCIAEFAGLGHARKMLEVGCCQRCRLGVGCQFDHWLAVAQQISGWRGSREFPRSWTARAAERMSQVVATVETLIQEHLRLYYLKRERASLARVVEEIRIACKIEGLAPPPLCQGSCPLLYFSSIYQAGGIGLWFGIFTGT